MSAFDTLIPEVQDFCRRLAADNTAEFYKAHKAEYLSRLKRPAELLLDSLAPRIAEMTGGTVTTKLFRINRDLRFAKGQPPYNGDRIVRFNSREQIDDQARQNFRVSVTRGKRQTTILTPKGDPCVLLLGDDE